MKWKVYSYFQTGCLTDWMSLKEKRKFKKASVLREVDVQRKESSAPENGKGAEE